MLSFIVSLQNPLTAEAMITICLFLVFVFSVWIKILSHFLTEQ